MSYPAHRILDEFATIQAAVAGHCLARFGDGELRLASGRAAAASQKLDGLLSVDLRRILAGQTKALPCIPNPDPRCPKLANWRHYMSPSYSAMLQARRFGSAFVSRPDSAPWIDTPDYWRAISRLWRDRDVVVVRGDRKGLTSEMLTGQARSHREIIGPPRDAYASISQLEEQIGTPSGTVLLSLGATATVLADRLAARNVHAVDVGHLGMFMRRLGVVSTVMEDVVSPDYRIQLERVHAEQKWGTAGRHHAQEVLAFAGTFKEIRSILDYGCGRGTLVPTLEGMQPGRFELREFDPGIPEKAALPEPADLVVCTDVLEHVEPSRHMLVLHHLARLARRGAFFVIASNRAKLTLPDGRNAHLIRQPDDWWLSKLRTVGFTVARHEKRTGLFVWCTK